MLSQTVCLRTFLTRLRSVWYSRTIHVWYIYLHLPFFCQKQANVGIHIPYMVNVGKYSIHGKCRYTYTIHGKCRVNIPYMVNVGTCIKYVDDIYIYTYNISPFLVAFSDPTACFFSGFSGGWDGHETRGHRLTALPQGTGNLSVVEFFCYTLELTWNLQITHLERKMTFQTSMIMVHVNLPGCMPTPSWNKQRVYLWKSMLGRFIYSFPCGKVYFQVLLLLVSGSVNF